MKKWQLKMLIVSLAFLSIMVLVTSPSLSIIEQERPIVNLGNNSFTVGDFITLFGLFGTTISVVLFFMSRRR